MNPALIDLLYEAAFVPECWPSALEGLATVANAHHGWITFSNKDITFCAGSTESVSDMMRRLIDRNALMQFETWRRAHRLKHAGFIVDHDIFREDELKDDPLYREILYPNGLGYMTGTVLELPTGDHVTLCLDRAFARGPVEREQVALLDTLRPHLARASYVAARLRLERARAVSQTLAALGLPALVLDGDRRVLAANSLIEALGGFLHWRAHDRIALKDSAADRLLQDAMGLIETSDLPSTRSFPARDPDAQETLVAHLLPVRRAARDIFARSVAVLMLTPVALPQAPPVELVQSLFDLTPSEARVARLLACGETVDDIAKSGNVSAGTIRTHLRGVLAKTGCKRQAEVVGLLGGLWPCREPPVRRADGAGSARRSPAE